LASDIKTKKVPRGPDFSVSRDLALNNDKNVLDIFSAEVST